MVYNIQKIDLNTNPATFSCNDELNKNDLIVDTTLRLECHGYGGSDISRANTRGQKKKSAPNDGCRLVLGLGPTPGERDSILKLSLSPHSSTDQNPFSNHQSVSIEVNNRIGFGNCLLDEGSTSAKKSGGYMPSLLLAPRISLALQKRKISEPEPSVVSDFLRATASNHQTSSRRCKFSGCANGQAEYSIAHGSRARCSHPTGCSKTARVKSELCIKQGGGKRCVSEVRSQSHWLVAVPGLGSPDNDSLSCASAVSNSTNWVGKPAKRRQMIPPQVLVPSSMKSSTISSFTREASSGTDNNGGRKSFKLVVPEGRVHGGNLLSLLGGNLRDAVIDGI